MRLIFDTSPVRPSLGLAVDEALLETVEACEEGVVRVWVNDAAVIVGRSQRVVDEVDVEQARVQGVPVLRRISGGGTVIHYPGNLNLSIVLPACRAPRSVHGTYVRYGEAIANGVRELGCSLTVEGNVIRCEGRKVSGAAQLRRRAVLYHATLLVQPVIDGLPALLRALSPGYAPADVPSRPCAMASLSEATGRGIPMDDAAAAALHGLDGVLPTRPWSGSLTKAERTRAAALEEEKYAKRAWNERR